MGRKVQIKTGANVPPIIVLPDGNAYKPGNIVILSGSQYQQLQNADFTYITDLGYVPDPGYDPTGGQSSEEQYPPT